MSPAWCWSEASNVGERADLLRLFVREQHDPVPFHERLARRGVEHRVEARGPRGSSTSGVGRVTTPGRYVRPAPS